MPRRLVKDRSAEADLIEIWLYTFHTWGKAQAALPTSSGPAYWNPSVPAGYAAAAGLGVGHGALELLLDATLEEGQEGRGPGVRDSPDRVLEASPRDAGRLPGLLASIVADRPTDWRFGSSRSVTPGGRKDVAGGL